MGSQSAFGARRVANLASFTILGRSAAIVPMSFMSLTLPIIASNDLRLMNDYLCQSVKFPRARGGLSLPAIPPRSGDGFPMRSDWSKLKYRASRPHWRAVGAGTMALPLGRFGHANSHANYRHKSCVVFCFSCRQVIVLDSKGFTNVRQ